MANELEQYLNPDEGSGMVRDPDGVFRVRIGGAAPNKLAARMEGKVDEPVEQGGVDIGTLLARLGSMIQGLGSNVGTAGVAPGEAPVAERARDRLLGTNGQERYQTWPEKMVRSGLTLPGDVVSGAQPMPLPGLRTEDMVELPRGSGFTSPWQQPGDRVIERAQDTSGLMGGGSIASVKAGEATLGSGPVRRLDNGFRPQHLDPTLKYLKSSNRLNDDGTISVFHVAPIENVESILKEGLIPGKSPASGQNWKPAYSGDGTYFHGTRKAALENLAQTEQGSHQVLEARIPATEKNLKKFLPDEDVSSDPMDGIHALARGESTAVLGGVKPEYLRLLSDQWMPTVDMGVPMVRNPLTGDMVPKDLFTPTGRISTTYLKEIGDYVDHNPNAPSHWTEAGSKNMAELHERLVGDGWELKDNRKSTRVYSDPNTTTGYRAVAFSDKPATYVKGDQTIKVEPTHNDDYRAQIKIGKDSKFEDLEPHKTAKYARAVGDAYGVDPSKLMSDSAVPGAPISAIAKQQAPAFYSAVEHSVMNAPQPKMSYDQWMGYLKNQPGVKGEELAWMGLGEKNPFEGKSVSKEQMQDWVNNHKVEIKEVKKGNKDLSDPEYEAGMRDEYENQFGHPPENTVDLMDWMEDTGMSDTKFGSYQLPGAENYREVLFTLPSKTADRVGAMDRYAKLTNEADRRNLTDAEHAEMVDLERVLSGQPAGSSYGGDYRSSHWDEPNVLAHTRLNDRVIDGKKSLHVEEIQSDWHQEGRKKGYKEDVPTKEEIHAARDDASAARVDLGSHILEKAKQAGVDLDDSGMSLIHKIEAGELPANKVPWWLDTPEYHAIAKEYKDAWDKQGALIKKTQGVPDAPFKTTWPDLVLKRLIREASEKGYDQISWTPGEAQAARYDLSKQVDQLKWSKNDDGTFNLSPYKDGRLVGHATHHAALMENVAHPNVPADKLADFVGKDVADKIIAGEGAVKSKKTLNVGDKVKLNLPDIPAFKDLIGQEGVIDKRMPSGQHQFTVKFPNGDRRSFSKAELVPVGNNLKGELSGLDLKVGGEGMKAFYDKMLVDKANALGKKFGAKVNKGSTGVSFDAVDPKGNVVASAPTRAEMEAWVARMNESNKDLGVGDFTVKDVGSPVYVLPITDKMREAAIGKGFPLFASGIPFPLVPVEDNPWKIEQ